MNTPLPYNRLQRVLFARWWVSVTIHLFAIFAILVAFFFTEPTYAAFPTNFNPTNANYSLNALPTTVRDCLLAETCDAMIYAGWDGSNYRTMLRTFADGFYQKPRSMTYRTDFPFNYPWPGNMATCVGNCNYYWNGSSWSVDSNYPYLRTTATGDDALYYNLMLTTFPLKRGSATFDGYGIPPGTADDIILEQYWFPTGSATLSNVSFPPFTPGSLVSFNATWTDVTTFTPRYIRFYEDANDNDSTIVYGTGDSIGEDGSYVISHFYQYAGNYTPLIDITDCSSSDYRTNPSCHYIEAYTDLEIEGGSTVQNQLSQNYPSTFSAFPTQDIIVGTSVHFNYDVNEDLCSPGTVSGRRLFKGYPSAIAYKDSGAILSTESGSIDIVYDETAQPYSDYFFPFVRAFCSGGSAYDIFLGGKIVPGGTFPTSMPQGITVYQPGDVRFSLPDSWLNGGQSGSYLFESDKHVYNVGEPVKLHWTFDTPSAPTSIDVYDDVSNGQLLTTLDAAADLTESRNHYMTISYANKGEYYPFIVIHYSGGSRTVYLGGDDDVDPHHAIVVQDTVQPLYVNTGSYLGQFGGTGGLVNRAGIFGFSPTTWAGFGSSGNFFLDQAQSLLAKVLYGAVWAASKVYAIVSETDLFSFFNDIIAPPPGRTYTTPSSLFGIQLPSIVAGQSFTIAYATESSMGFVTRLLQALLAFGIIIALFRYITH